MKKISSLFKIVLPLAAILFASCSAKYAVSLIETNNMECGKIYKVRGTTFQRNGLKNVQYLILSEGRSESFNEPITCAKTFSSKGKAKSFLRRYKPLVNIYAVATANHIIRPEKSPKGSDYYRLREGEKVKVLAKDEDPTTIDGKTGHWLEVLTKDGYHGYSFDYKLKLVDDGKIINSEGDSTETDDFIALLATPFYPFFYNDYISEKRINLSELAVGYGLYLNDEKNKLIFKTDKIDLEYEIESVIKASKDRYYVDSDNFNISIINENYIILSLNFNDENVSFDMCRIDNFDVIIEAEQNARAAFYNKLLSMGPTFSSSAYGTITFYRDYSFKWNGFESLVPAQISANASTQGFVSFDLHMTNECSKKYDDAVALIFNRSGGALSPFFIQIDEEAKAFRFYTIPTSLVNSENLVTSDSASPQIIYFKKAGN